MLAAERQRMIYDYARKSGAVTVPELSTALNVAPNTIRRDLDKLAKDGKLLRSHGGAVVRERPEPVPPYAETRSARMPEKTLIASAALRYLPESGFVFLNSGSTVLQFASLMPDNSHISVVTTSLAVATELAANPGVTTYILGGKVNSDPLDTDCSFSAPVIDKLHFNVSFIGVEAIDIASGITSSYLHSLVDSDVIERSQMVVALCDSSKFGRVGNARICDADVPDVIITDAGVDPELLDQFISSGVKVKIAGATGSE